MLCDIFQPLNISWLYIVSEAEDLKILLTCKLCPNYANVPFKTSTLI